MEILYPMFGMIFVTAIVMMLLYISRIQALSNRSKNPNRLPNEVARHSDEIRKYMTPRNRFITENYNHLFEQPTLFSRDINNDVLSSPLISGSALLIIINLVEF